MKRCLVLEPGPVCGTCCKDKGWQAGLAALLPGAGGPRPELEFNGVCLCGYFFVLLNFLSPE